MGVERENLEKSKPVLVCGDLNVAHKEIDLARPKANYNKSAGFMQAEIDGIDRYISNGLIDTFRLKNSDEVKYSWWSYRANARNNNKGWRIDYNMVSEPIKERIKRAYILPEAKHSDHCPIALELDI